MSQSYRYPFAVGKYNFNWEVPVLNDPRYNSPVPCTHGRNCYYHGYMGSDGKWVEKICTRVHPGEEGVGRKIFYARNKYERDQVRLYSDKNAQGVLIRQTFYERMRLGKTWPEWCKMMGYPLPQRPVNKPIEHVRQQIIQSNVFDDEEQVIMAIDPEEDRKEDERLEQQCGDNMYRRIDACLQTPEVKPYFTQMGWTAPTITTGKITGMILQAFTAFEQLECYKNPAVLYEAIMDCCEILQEAYNQTEQKNPLSFANCGVKPGALWGDCMI
jgi:hypothetical protein